VGDDVHFAVVRDAEAKARDADSKKLAAVR